MASSSRKWCCHSRSSPAWMRGWGRKCARPAVMGHASSFGHAFAKAQMAANAPLPQSGTVLVSVNPYDVNAMVKLAQDLVKLGFKLVATVGTAKALGEVGITAESGHHGGGRPQAERRRPHRDRLDPAGGDRPDYLHATRRSIARGWLRDSWRGGGVWRTDLYHADGRGSRGAGDPFGAAEAPARAELADTSLGVIGGYPAGA